jgi:hypothetical protein
LTQTCCLLAVDRITILSDSRICWLHVYLCMTCCLSALARHVGAKLFPEIEDDDAALSLLNQYGMASSSPNRVVYPLATFTCCRVDLAMEHLNVLDHAPCSPTLDHDALFSALQLHNMASLSLRSRKRRRVDSDTIAVTSRQAVAATTELALRQAQVNATDTRRSRSAKHTESTYPNTTPRKLQRKC